MKTNRETILTEIAKDNEWYTTCKNIVSSQSLFDYQNNSYVENEYLVDELYSEFLLHHQGRCSNIPLCSSFSYSLPIDNGIYRIHTLMSCIGLI